MSRLAEPAPGQPSISRRRALPVSGVAVVLTTSPGPLFAVEPHACAYEDLASDAVMGGTAYGLPTDLGQGWVMQPVHQFNFEARWYDVTFTQCASGSTITVALSGFHPEQQHHTDRRPEAVVAGALASEMTYEVEDVVVLLSDAGFAAQWPERSDRATCGCDAYYPQMGAQLRRWER